MPGQLDNEKVASPAGSFVVGELEMWKWGKGRSGTQYVVVGEGEDHKIKIFYFTS